MNGALIEETLRMAVAQVLPVALAAGGGEGNAYPRLECCAQGWVPVPLLVIARMASFINAFEV